MTSYDRSYRHFYRRDPQPWIPFDDATTTRGDVAVLLACVAGLVLIAFGVL